MLFRSDDQPPLRFVLNTQEIKIPRVLHIIDSLGVGGAETWLMELIRLWAETNKIKIDLLLTSGRTAYFDEEAKRLGCNLFYLQYSKTRLYDFILKFRKILRNTSYMAIHDHQDYAAGWHYLIGTGLLPEIRIVHVHNPAYQIKNNYGVTIRRRVTAAVGKYLVGKYATLIAGTSEQILNEYGFHDEKFDHVRKAAFYCGIKTDRFSKSYERSHEAIARCYNWPADCLIVLVVGRIDASPDPRHPRVHKNSSFAVDICIAAASRSQNIRVLFVGKRSKAVIEFHKRIQSAGLSGRIIFAGIRDDVSELMCGANVLLFPSRGEGLGMVAVEAQAAGLPVIMSDAVPREAIVVNELVHVLGIKTDVAAWASHVISVALTRTENSSANASVKNSKFSIESSAANLTRLYLEDSLDQ